MGVVFVDAARYRFDTDRSRYCGSGRGSVGNAAEVLSRDAAYSRHGFFRYAVVRDGDVVSSAMTTAEWTGGALIGGVATAPTHRRRGLAGTCVHALVGALKREGRQVYICPKKEGAMRLYTELGFSVCGEIAQVERT